jgi:hypothetical protein
LDVGRINQSDFHTGAISGYARSVQPFAVHQNQNARRIQSAQSWALLKRAVADGRDVRNAGQRVLSRSVVLAIQDLLGDGFGADGNFQRVAFAARGGD